MTKKQPAETQPIQNLFAKQHITNALNNSSGDKQKIQQKPMDRQKSPDFEEVSKRNNFKQVLKLH